MSELTGTGIRYRLDGKGEATVTGAVGKPYALAIPSRVGTHVVTGIGDRAFFQDYLLRHVSLPPTIRYIGEEAFAGAGIERLKVPDGVTSMGRRAFASCGRLRLASLPGTLTLVPEACFQGCGNLAMLGLGYGIEAIRINAFEGCTSLARVSLPETVRVVGNLAFACCTHLSAVYLPKSGIELGEGVFKHCEALSFVAIPTGTRSIPAWAFFQCSSLSEVSLGEGLLSIGKRAFRGCGSLQSLEVPKGVTTIGDEALYGCRSLRLITIPNTVVTIGREAFAWCGSEMTCLCEEGSYAECYCRGAHLNRRGLFDKGIEDIPRKPLEAESVTLVKNRGQAIEYRVLKRLQVGGREYAVLTPVEEEFGPVIDAEVYLVRHGGSLCTYEPIPDASEFTAVGRALDNEGFLLPAIDYIASLEFDCPIGILQTTQ